MLQIQQDLKFFSPTLAFLQATGLAVTKGHEDEVWTYTDFLLRPITTASRSGEELKALQELTAPTVLRVCIVSLSERSLSRDGSRVGEHLQVGT